MCTQDQRKAKNCQRNQRQRDDGSCLGLLFLSIITTDILLLLSSSPLSRSLTPVCLPSPPPPAPGLSITSETEGNLAETLEPKEQAIPELKDVQILINTQFLYVRKAGRQQEPSLTDRSSPRPSFLLSDSSNTPPNLVHLATTLQIFLYLRLSYV